MERKLTRVDNREDIPFKPKDTYIVESPTIEDFVDFVSDIVNNQEKEMIFHRGDNLTYAIFEEDSVVYLYTETDEDKRSARSRTRDKPLPKSGLFTNLMLILVLITSTLMPYTATAATHFSGSVAEDPIIYTGLQQAKFNTPAGVVTIPGYLNVVNTETFRDTAFSLTDPNRIKSFPTVRLEALPNGISEDMLTAILAYRLKFSLAQIQSSTGLQIDQRQLDEATQLAVWMHASASQITYQIDPNSINDSAVRTLATEINSWATKQVTSLVKGMKIGDYLFTPHKPSLVTKDAKVTKEDSFIDYGPYVISGQKDAKFQFGVLGGTVIDNAKKKASVVTVGQPFYVRFPANYNGNKSVRLVGTETSYELNYGVQRIWLNRHQKENEIQFTVGQDTGAGGLIQVNAVDALTGSPVAGLNVEVETTSPIGALLTNEKGTGQFKAPVGTYTLKFSAPDGYMAPANQTVRVEFAGDIQTINLVLNWTKAVVNFYAVNSQTLAPAGDSEAFIYDSNGKAIKRLAIKDGKITGVTLPEGLYKFVQYKAESGFGINIGTEFRATAGKVQDISISQSPNVLPSVITIKGASTEDAWVYTVSDGSNVLFKMNSNNTLTLPLPPGRYSVMAVKSDGTSSTPAQNFTTVLNEKTDVTLEKEVGTETVSFNYVDMKNQEPIPNLVIGLFDEKHNLITYAKADSNGVVKFENVKKYSIYYVNVLAAPDSVSGYSANGNKFLGYTRHYEIELYSKKEILEKTKIDTIYRVPNVTYVGPNYTYPE